MKPIRRAGAVLISAALAFLINGALAHAQGRGGNAPAEPPTLKGKVTAYEADRSITLETPIRGGEAKKTEFSIVKDKTRIELGAGVKAIEPGMTVSVWADKDNPKNAARIAAQVAAPGRGRGGAGVAPPDKGENPKPAAPAAPPAPGTEESAAAKKVPDASGTNVGKNDPTELNQLLGLIKPAGEQELVWRGIPWMTDVAKARQKAAAEGKMIVHYSCTRHPLGMC